MMSGSNANADSTSVDGAGFKYDVFISWRIDDTKQDEGRAERLKKYLEGEGLTVSFIDSVSLTDIGSYQSALVVECQVMIVLLGAKGLHSSDSATMQDARVPTDAKTRLKGWGFQYRELNTVKEFNEAIDEFGGEDEATKRRKRIQLVACSLYFEGNKTIGVTEYCKRFLPVDGDRSRGIPQPNRRIVDLLQNSAANAPALLTTQSENDEGAWQEQILRTIRKLSDAHGIVLPSDRLRVAAAAKSKTQPPPHAVGFDAVEYVEMHRELWKGGQISKETQGEQWKPVHVDHRIELTVSSNDGADFDESVSAVRYVREQARERRLLVVGEPGSGKTTLLTQSAYRDAEEFLASDGAVIGDVKQRCPFVVSARFLVQHLASAEPPSFVGALARAIGRPEGALATFMEANPVAIYIDGLDEIVDDALRNALFGAIKRESGIRTGKLRNAKLVLSSRYHNASLDDQERVYLNSLESGQIDRYIIDYPRAQNLDEDKERRFRQNFNNLRRRLESEASPETGTRPVYGSVGQAAASRHAWILNTPFMLDLLCFLLETEFDGGNAESYGSMVYVSIMGGVLRNIQRRAEKELGRAFEIEEALARLAAAEFKHGMLDARQTDRTLLGLGSVSSPREDQIEVPRLKQFLRRHAIVLRENPHGGLSFSHSLFGEFFIALSRAKRCVSIETADLIWSELQQEAVGQNLFHRIRANSIIPCIMLRSDLHGGQRNPGDLTGPAVHLLKRMIARIADSADDSSSEAESAATAFRELLQSFRGIWSHLAASDDIEEEIIRAYRSNQSRWPPADREMAVSAAAGCYSDDRLWSQITGVKPGWIPAPAGSTLVPIWLQEDRRRSIEFRKLAVAISPVTVKEYKAFAEAPDRYDPKYWPGSRRSDLRTIRASLGLSPKIENDGNDDPLPPHGLFVLGDLEAAGFQASPTWADQQSHLWRPVVNVTKAEAVAYALWRSEREGRSFRLPGPAEWSHIRTRLCGEGLYPWGDEEPTSESGPWTRANIAQALVRSPSTIGTFPPLECGLVDFGSNVGCWLADYASDWTTIWPPPVRSEANFWAGANYNSHADDARSDWIPAREPHDARLRYVGFWLIASD